MQLVFAQDTTLCVYLVIAIVLLWKAGWKVDILKHALNVKEFIMSAYIITSHYYTILELPIYITSDYSYYTTLH